MCTICLSKPESLDGKIDNMTNVVEPVLCCIIVMCSMHLLLCKSSNQRCIIGTIISHDVSKLLFYCILLKNCHNHFSDIGCSMGDIVSGKSNDGVHVNAYIGCNVHNKPKGSHSKLWTSPAITGEINWS